MSIVRAEFHPTLPEVVGPRAWRMIRAAAIVVAVAALVVALVVRSGSQPGVVVSKPVAFNYVYGPPLHRTGEAGVIQRRGSLLVQSMTVAPTTLPPYAGSTTGILPIVAERLEAQLKARWSAFDVADEGRARINGNPGYTVGWVARVNGRRIFGRDYLLFPPDPHPRAGAHLELLSTYAGGVSAAANVGRVGALKTALRSFRFGTERP